MLLPVGGDVEEGPIEMYPKARLDALTDGLFGVAMTILVLDVRLPEDFHPSDHGSLFRALIALWPKFFPYALSFFVLGIRWLSSVQVKIKSELVSAQYARWWLLYLFLITCVPFATILVGRFPDEAPAICFYAGTTALIAVVAWRTMSLLPDLEPGTQIRARQSGLVVLFVSSLIAIAVSFITPRLAMWAFALNVVTPILDRWLWSSDRPAHPGW
jgi:uncharacterized membrane protein